VTPIVRACEPRSIGASCIADERNLLVMAFNYRVARFCVFAFALSNGMWIEKEKVTWLEQNFFRVIDGLPPNY
jgi:hypothetical protein